MAIFDLYSKRQKRIRGEYPDIFTYDNFPQTLKIQIVQIIQDAIGEGLYSTNRANDGYNLIHKTLCREYGRHTLRDTNESNQLKVLNFLLATNNIEEILDVVELSFKFIEKIIKKDYFEYTSNIKVNATPDDAINELNERFKEHGIGYSYESGEIIRIDSTLIHSEITKPVLTLLFNSKFKGANEEYLKAHEHYRASRNKECLTECLKAFESTMKIICNEKGWAFNQTDNAKKLIQICFQNNLVPAFTQNQFTSLQNLLESGIPTIRNKVGGHGQGQIPQKVDDEMTRYGLNLTGTNIIFLIEQSGIK